MKICIQSGHKGITTGATGAPGERDWTTAIVPMIANKLKDKIEVYQTDALAYNDSIVTDTDWDLFIAIHYDADIYNDRGGFYDYPDETIDDVWETSKNLSEQIGKYYFEKTLIPVKLNRSNANTKFYYMWQYLTSKTPCMIIECGVGNRKPEDYTVLRNYDLISQTFADAILKAFNINGSISQIQKLQLEIIDLTKQLDEMRISRNKWKDEAAELAEKISSLKEQVESVQKTNSELTAQLTLSNKTNKEMIDQLNGRIDKLTSENKTLTDDSMRLQDTLNSVSEQNKKLEIKLEEQKAEIKTLNDKIKLGLKGYTKWQLFKEWWAR